MDQVNQRAQWIFLRSIDPDCQMLQSGPNVIRLPFFFSSVYPFTVLKLNFLSIVRWNHNPKLLSQNKIIPPSHPLSQCCAEFWSSCQYGVDQHWKWGAEKIADKYAWVVQHFWPWLYLFMMMTTTSLVAPDCESSVPQLKMAYGMVPCKKSH